MPDGDGLSDGSWVLGAKGVNEDPAGYTNYPRCFANIGGYIQVNAQKNNEIEIDTMYLPVTYPIC